jgi:pectate lyase
VTGGAGGTVATVTNLNNSGAGSLRDAIASNRIIRFALGGAINLSSDINITASNLTIDGFSAPSPGITIAGRSITVWGNASGANATGSNIIIQGLRFRDAGNANGDAIQIAYNAHDIVVDHNSISLPAVNGDGAIDITEGAYNITVSHNLLDYSKSGDGPGASLLAYNASRVSYHHNIFHGARDRNPILTCDYTQNYSTGTPHTDILADVRYNIVWNYGIGTYIMSSDGCVGAANVVANLYKNNGSTNSSNVVVRSSYDSTARANAYIAGNVAVHDPRGCAYPYNNDPCFNFQTTNSQNNHAEFAAPAISGPSATDQTGRLAAWQTVKATAGVASMYADDSTDAAVRAAIAIPTVSVFSQVWSD